MNFTNIITGQLALDLGQEIGPLVGEIMGDDGFKGSSELNCDVTRGRRSEKWQDVRAKLYPVCIRNGREIWPSIGGIWNITRLDAIFEPYRAGLARRA